MPQFKITDRYGNELKTQVCDHYDSSEAIEQLKAWNRKQEKKGVPYVHYSVKQVERQGWHA